MQQEQKVVLPVDIFNDDHLQELIENPETYGEFTKTIIKTLGKLITNKLTLDNPNFKVEFEDFIGEVIVKPKN